MQASRASSRVLKAVAASTKQTRSLHMTGPATFSSLLTSERPALNPPRDIEGLRVECQKRKLPTAGTRDELMNRLSAHELTSARSFSTLVRDLKRPVPAATDISKPARHFNTSRSLKAVRDSSTIDFAYLPDYDPDAGSAPILRVPILPQTRPSEATKAVNAVANEPEVVYPNILTVAADGTHIHAPSTMADVSDNNAIDFQGMAARVANTISKPVGETASMAGQIWGGLVDDVLGPKSQRQA
ncbi:hypothetical protein BDV95DRAFT_389759 [Massariosphaeria phaeospora]|uniref:SAP domain-containing protein n=1 Tax=Massariosphaeria phaeospora TaxID=100035 RepID=A0A7C8I9D9_9PLEO|nr:hypothetical protein BDV95DRAFT_389759 [Massariosphaeria phaeospora]